MLARNTIRGQGKSYPCSMTPVAMLANLDPLSTLHLFYLRRWNSLSYSHLLRSFIIAAPPRQRTEMAGDLMV